jgi:hypothetical protein
LPVHNEALSGDELTTIQFNHEWRRIVASALSYYFRDFETDLGLDNEDLFNGVLVDLYTAESMANKLTILGILLAANRTRNQATFATVSGTEKPHTFTKPNAKVTYSNVRCDLSNTTQLGSLRVGLSAGSVVQQVETGCNSTTPRNVRVAAIFSGIPLGVSTNCLLEFAASGGATITVYPAHNMLIEIEEWD